MSAFSRSWRVLLILTAVWAVPYHRPAAAHQGDTGQIISTLNATIPGAFRLSEGQKKCMEGGTAWGPVESLLLDGRLPERGKQQVAGGP
jgi:hypothetical protein